MLCFPVGGEGPVPHHSIGTEKVATTSRSSWEGPWACGCPWGSMGSVGPSEGLRVWGSAVQLWMQHIGPCSRGRPGSQEGLGAAELFPAPQEQGGRGRRQPRCFPGFSEAGGVSPRGQAGEGASGKERPPQRNVLLSVSNDVKTKQHVSCFSHIFVASVVFLISRGRALPRKPRGQGPKASGGSRDTAAPDAGNAATPV